MKKTSRIYIAGSKGLVGSAIVRELSRNGYKNLILTDRKKLDLMDHKAVENFFKKEKPEYVFMAAARVGGIHANNTYPADFIYQNLTIQNNIIHNSYINRVKKLVFLGSSCIYPRLSRQPIKEEYLLTGELEPTNQAYALAKIAGIVMCQSYNKQFGTNYISLMPTNLYGPNDNYDLENSHVLPALIRRFHEAKVGGKNEVVLWGDGKAKREFLHVDDMAKASIFLMLNHNDSEIINVGTGEDVSIKELASMVKKAVGFEGKIVWDTTKPNGTPRKLLDVNKINKLGWKHEIKLHDGIKQTYKEFLKTL